MANLYYLDTNALIKYSYYQQYLTHPENNVDKVRDLINHKEHTIYLSHLTLWEFSEVLLKKYRTNEKWMVFGNTPAARQSNLMHLFFEIKEKTEEGYFCINNTALTPEIFEMTQRLMLKYIGGQRRALGSIDALHIALIQFLNTKNDENIILVSADKVMIEISEQEGISVLAI